MKQSLLLTKTVSPWGATVPEEIHYEYKLFEFGNTDSISANFVGEPVKVETPSIDLGFGEIPSIELFEGGANASLYAAWDLNFALLAELSLAVGSVTVDYAIDLDAKVSNVADTLNARSYVDTKLWSVASGSLFSTGTNPDDSSAELYLSARIGGSLGGSAGGYAEVFDETVFNDSVSFNVIPAFSYTDTALIVGIYPGEAIEFDSNWGSLTAELPSTPELETSTLVVRADGYANLSVSGVGDTFVTATLDLSKIVATSLGIPLSGSWAESPFPLVAEVNFSLVEAQLVSDLALEQVLTFVPGDVDVTMKSSFAPTVDTQGKLLTLGETVTGKLGERFEFSTPQGEGTFSVTATYILDGLLTNTLYLKGSANFDLSFVQADLNLSLGIDDYSLPIYDDGYTFYEDSFELAGGRLLTFPSVSQKIEMTVLTTTYNVAYENFYTGTEGQDTFTLTTRQTFADGLGGADLITGNVLDNHILGGGGADRLYGQAGNDRLEGGAQSDQLFGGDGDDRLIGGNHTDYLTGGAGRDVFVAELGIKEQLAKKGGMSVDVITDFVRGTDLIDLTGIDANLTQDGLQSFRWTTQSISNRAGELSIQTFGGVVAAELSLGIDIDGVAGASPYSGPVTVVLGNVDGGAFDFGIVLLNTSGITSSDLYL